MTISISDRLHRYAATLNKTWAHDRSKTVGASEIGQCARKTFFSKQNAPRDADYEDGFGARLRGNVIEEHYWEPGLRATLDEGESLLFAGNDQKTLERGYLSATTDGLFVSKAFDICINLDCKSIDPRADISKEKSSHHFQVQAQMGLIRDCTEYKPDNSILSYVDASFWDKITEFVIPFNPRIYAAAHARAERIMTARDALELPPEGKTAGGGECQWCAWASHCATVTITGVPKRSDPISDDIAEQLHGLRDEERRLAAIEAEAKVSHAEASESIKQFLRQINVRRFVGDEWSVSYSIVNGRATLDIDAIKAAGIDLAPYYKTGSQSERLIIK
jgi:hypothetical protein